MKKILKCILAACVILAVSIWFRQPAEASEWDDAYTYYTTYGDQAVFHATSQRDGNIYCATRGATASTGIRYRAIGWEMDIKDTAGNVVQVLFFQLGGSYLVNTNTVQTSTHIYQLYELPLSTVRSRMNENVKEAMDRGECFIELNACMVVVRNNVVQGTMNDYGVTSGAVYTTYNGIVEAENWSDASKNALSSYFNKSVNGLFYTVSVSGGPGIASVSGGGTYCYGTRVTISASPSNGYRFSDWSGNGVGYSDTFSFYVNGNSSWYASAKKKSTIVTFYRNSTVGDTTFRKQIFTYGESGQYFAETGFLRSGYQLMGWAHQSNATAAQYTVYHPVSDEWILDNYPAVSLYAVWKANSYTICFDGNGALSGSVASIATSYGRTETLPENGFEKPVENCTFLGWGMSSGAVLPDYKQNQAVAVSELVQKTGIQNRDNGVITLYAIWDMAPVMETADLYYSLTDAQNGVITEEELSGRVKVTDQEDGTISYGNHEKNSLVLIDYAEEKFLNAVADTAVSVTYETIDSAGNRVTQTILVHLVDTTITEGSLAVGKIRLIDMDYFMDTDGTVVPESAGGLKSTSRWLCEENLKNLLWEVLREANMES